MRILLIDNGSLYFDKIKELIGDHSIITVTPNSISALQENDYDLIILSGGHDYPVTENKDSIFHGLNFAELRNLSIYKSHRWVVKELSNELIGLARK